MPVVAVAVVAVVAATAAAVVVLGVVVVVAGIAADGGVGVATVAIAAAVAAPPPPRPPSGGALAGLDVVRTGVAAVGRVAWIPRTSALEATTTDLGRGLTPTARPASLARRQATATHTAAALRARIPPHAALDRFRRPATRVVVATASEAPVGDEKRAPMAGADADRVSPTPPAAFARAHAAEACPPRPWQSLYLAVRQPAPGTAQTWLQRHTRQPALKQPALALLDASLRERERTSQAMVRAPTQRKRANPARRLLGVAVAPGRGGGRVVAAFAGRPSGDSTLREAWNVVCQTFA